MGEHAASTERPMGSGSWSWRFTICTFIIIIFCLSWILFCFPLPKHIAFFPYLAAPRFRYKCSLSLCLRPSICMWLPGNITPVNRLSFPLITPPIHIVCTHIPSCNSLFVFFLSISLQARIKTAQRRVVMASLYLGTGQLEQELVRKEGFVHVCVFTSLRV